jgi:hypothetical protein
MPQRQLGKRLRNISAVEAFAISSTARHRRIDPEPSLSSYKDYWIQYYREVIEKVHGYRHDAISLEKQMSELGSNLRKIQRATEREKKY